MGRADTVCHSGAVPWPGADAARRQVHRARQALEQTARRVVLEQPASSLFAD